MIAKALMFKYPEIMRLELVCINFDNKFAYTLRKLGYQYQQYSRGIYYKIYAYDSEVAKDIAMKDIAYLTNKRIKIKAIDLRKTT